VATGSGHAVTRRAVRAAANVVVALATSVMACAGGDDGAVRDDGGAADEATTTETPSATAPTATAGGVCWTAPPVGGQGVAFADATEAVGLVDPLTGMHGHATAAADVDGDGWTDLFVGGFADRPADEYRQRGADGPTPDRLLRGSAEGFTIDATFPGEPARTSGATFADLDADGDLDLVVVRNPRPNGEIAERPTTVYRNDGDAWSAVTTLLPATSARSVAALDVDRDGLPDLAVAGDRFGEGSTRLLRNTGGLGFEDASDEWGIPDDVLGLALAPVDLDGDGWLDVVVSGDRRVLRGEPGGFTVVDQPVLAWQTYGDEDDPAGVAVGDLDGDGRPDLAVGQHFNSTLDDGRRVPVRLFLNRSQPGSVRLVDVTEQAGSPGLWTKAPHAEIVDVDADGLADVVTSAVAADGTPVVLHNQGVTDGVPRFEVVGQPGDGRYWITGIADDVDHDGRLDAFMVEWEPELPSVLFRNAGGGGPWVAVDVSALGAAATGARVEARRGADVLATAWAASTTGYAAGSPPVVHLGLGEAGDDMGASATVAGPAPGTADVELVVTSVAGEARTVTVPSGSRAALESC
jgi:enediyne biosynthesis protein E4